MERFYVEVLGLTVERRSEQIGMVQLRAGAQLVDLVAVDGMLGRQGGAGPGAEGRNLDHFCLNLEGFDLAEVEAHLKAHGDHPRRKRACATAPAASASRSTSPTRKATGWS